MVQKTPQNPPWDKWWSNSDQLRFLAGLARPAAKFGNIPCEICNLGGENFQFIGKQSWRGKGTLAGVEVLPCERCRAARDWYKMCWVLHKILSSSWFLRLELGFSAPLPGHSCFWAIKRALSARSKPWLPRFIWKHPPLKWLITRSAPPNPSPPPKKLLFSSFLISTAMTGQP